MSAALIEARKAAEAELVALATAGEARTWTDEERARVKELKETVLPDLDERDAAHATAVAIRDRKPAPPAAPDIRNIVLAPTVPGASPEVREVSPYGPDSKESWFVDGRIVRSSSSSDAEVREARERLSKHYAAAGDEGSGRAVRALSTTTDAEGGYLTPPEHLQNEFARYLVAGATTVGLVSKRPLPTNTTLIKIPKQDGATVVAQHTQNNALTETSATFTTVDATVYRYGGAQTIPNFLLDRSLPGIDGIVLADLGRQLALKVNTDIVGGTTPEGILNADSIGTATATAGTATWGDVYPAIVNAIMDCAASHYAGMADLSIVMAPRRWGWALAQVDSSYRPLAGGVNPQNAIGNVVGINGPESAQGPKPVGSILGIPVYLDSTIPLTNGASTDEDRIIVGAFSEAYLFQAAPKFAMSTEAEFLNDQTLCRVTQDVAFTAERYPGAFSVVSGTALNDV